MNWQPIETAPNDEELYILVAGKENGGRPIIWKSNRLYLLSKDWGSYFCPTHWMPLPAPPEAELAHNAQGERRP